MTGTDYSTTLLRILVVLTHSLLPDTTVLTEGRLVVPKSFGLVGLGPLQSDFVSLNTFLHQTDPLNAIPCWDFAKSYNLCIDFCLFCL